MKIHIIICFVLINLGIISSVQAQEYQENTCLVKLRSNFASNDLDVLEREGFPVSISKQVSENHNLYLLECKENCDVPTLVERLNKLKSVEWASPDFKLEKRTTPNDSRFPEQWNMDMVNAVDAWNITTGGTTVDGKEIVVAVIDDGFVLDHEDLMQNIWINENEIEGDGIDNDQNGYTDDHIGWNAQSSTGIHNTETHGTSVTGIIGARGNNNVGVSGINWNVKCMLITGTGLASSTIEAYEYVKLQRSLYESTNGAKGAFVVATNFSAGVPDVFPETFPILGLWCEMYDELGELGIISVGSTSNENSNVDEFGDMPSTCTSPYLIVVTNTDISDNKVSSAGFGPIHVDLGAPGRDAFTTAGPDNSSYEAFGGTSASAPHVAGTVALLFSSPCLEFIEDYNDNPSQVALSVKDAILDGVDPNQSLTGITTTEGRLNVYNSFERLRTFCNAETGPLSIIKMYPNPISPDDNLLRIEYQVPSFDPYTVEIFSALGQKVYARVVSPGFFDSTQLVTLDVSDLTQGLYYLRISNDENKVSASFFKSGL